MAINKTINKRTNTHGAMRNCIEYVLRQDKTSELLTYVTGPYCHDEINYDLVYRTFLEEKKMWDKDSGRMYAHNIISWHKDEQITPEQALEFGKEFAENWFSGFQTLMAVHKDKDHIHCHLVTNSVSYEDGRKLHNTKKDLERMKQLTNQMCRERGLTVVEKGNDDLRNRNGLKSRSEQEQLEEEIRDVRNQNSKLQIQVNKSSVEAVDEAQKKQKEAEKKMEQAEAKARNEKKSAELEIRKAKKEVKARTEKMRDIEYFWGMGYVTVILFAIVQNGAFQNDFIDFFRTPFMWYVRFCEWLVHPTYDNGFNQKIAYTGGEAWIIRILAIVAVLFILAIVMVTIVKVIKRYKKMWDEISQMFLLGSLSGIAVLGDVIREYLPVNLILTFGFINVGIMLLKMYFRKKFEEKSLYADNHYD